MKKIFIVAAAALTTLVACQKNELAAPAADSVLYATIEETDATKTYMDASNNIRWSEGDQVVAFMKTSLGLRYQIKDEYVGKTSGYFFQISSGSSSDLGAGIEWNHNIVYYPYSNVIEAEKSGNNYTLNVVLPSEQTYAVESFGNGSMAMVAVSENNNITFKNILGGMKLQLRGTQKVKSITLEGKNNEKLSGAATVTAYTDETKPAITMSQTASTSVTLNCGSGVQLNESSATEFVISLPPVLFSQGFTVTVTDTESKTYTVETDKANTVLRSSILNMPAFKLGNNPSEEEPGDDELIVPVVTVSLSSTSLKLYDGDTYQLTATVKPKDATDKTVVWSSDMPSVATVDQTGLATGVSAGTATISASAGGKVAKCTVTVSSRVTTTADYIDEYGINHGKGITIGMTIWAPVNCGYYEHDTDLTYGKLYQWGRKYGQGYECNLKKGTFTVVGTLDGIVWDNSSSVGLMTKKGNYYIANNIPFVTAATLYGGKNQIEFKIVETGTWDGYGVAVGAAAAPVNTEIPVVLGGDTIILATPEGEYDVYFDKENCKVWVMECGHQLDNEDHPDSIDTSTPTIEEGGISAITGQHINKSNAFFTSSSEYDYDWLYPQNDRLWNSGTEENPIKAEFDPCPNGWRVPTSAELKELSLNYSSWTSEEGQKGRWFTGQNPYSNIAPQVFLPASGYRDYYDGSGKGRNINSAYWSSEPYGICSFYLDFGSSHSMIYYYYRANGLSVRCVQE